MDLSPLRKTVPSHLSSGSAPIKSGCLQQHVAYSRGLLTSDAATAAVASQCWWLFLIRASLVRREFKNNRKVCLQVAWCFGRAGFGSLCCCAQLSILSLSVLSWKCFRITLQGTYGERTKTANVSCWHLHWDQLEKKNHVFVANLLSSFASLSEIWQMADKTLSF